MRLADYPGERRVTENVMHGVEGGSWKRSVTATAPTPYLTAGRNGHRPKLMKVLADPLVAIVAVEHRDRLMRFGAERSSLRLPPMAGARLVVVDPGETRGDRVQDMNELTSICAAWPPGGPEPGGDERGMTVNRARTKSVIVVADPSVCGMIRNRHLAWSRMPGWSEFRRMPEYKTQWYGAQLIVTVRFYPSTKTCSVCGYVKTEMSLGERGFQCEACGAEIDHLNAARNLTSLAAGSSPETQNACGAEAVEGFRPRPPNLPRRA